MVIIPQEELEFNIYIYRKNNQNCPIRVEQGGAQGLEISSFLDMKLKSNCQFNSKMVMKLNMNNCHYQLS